MYVCICNPTTEEQIKECSRDGCTLNELVTNLDICQNCKTCSFEIQRIFNENTNVKVLTNDQ